MMQKSIHLGFTLIELLVVVLIIGILAAVALPQYQKAVKKARLSRLLPLMKTIENAQTNYYLTTGEYSMDFDNLAIDIGGEACPNGAEFSKCRVQGDITCYLELSEGGNWNCSDAKVPGIRLEKYYRREYAFCWFATASEKAICQLLSKNATECEDNYCTFPL